MTPMAHSGRIKNGALAAIAPLLLAVAVWGVRAAGQEQAEPAENPYAGKSCLSAGCHADLAEPEVVHAPVKNNECSECHEQEDETNHEFSMIAEGAELCYECHDESEIAETDEGGSVHQPVAQGECAGCHEPHASGHKGLLIEAYAEDFYVPIAESDKYALCFECHDYELIEESETDVTEFRNGELNLHYLHVSKERKGRSCRTCHESHLSEQAGLVRRSVPFGRWKMKLRFVATDTGGACGPSCHSAKQYDREEPCDFSQAPSLKELRDR